MKGRLRSMLTILTLASLSLVGQTPRSRFDPAPAHRAGNQKGFLDWTLSQINPRDIDYGARIEAVRQTVLDSTLRDPSYRMDILLIGTLCFLYICYWWECRRSTNLKVSTARIVTACHNELQAAREQIARLSSEYTQAKRVLDERTEAASRIIETAGARRESAPANGEKKNPVAAGSPNGQLSRDELLIENNSLKQQVRTLTMKWQEEQQRNRKLKGQ